MTIWILTIPILVLSEAAHFNLHTLQLTQSNHLHFIHITETVVSNSQRFQLQESRQIQLSEIRLTHTIIDNDLGHSGSERR